MKIDLFRVLARLYLKKKKISRGDIDVNKVDTILFFSSTAIGDTLFATPALKLIKTHYPNKKVIALLNPKNYKLFATNPHIDDFFLFNGKWSGVWSIVRRLKGTKIDVSLIMNGNEPQATPLAYFLGSKYIIRVPNYSNEFNHLHFNQPTKKDFSKNTIYTRLQQLESIGITERSYTMDLFPESSWYESVKTVVSDKEYKYVGMQIGASTPSRMWLNDNWILLANKILDYDANIKVFLTGSPAERVMTNTIEQGVNSERLSNLAGRFDICSAAALLGSLDLLITPDTGPLHIAAALKTPTVAISVAGLASSSNPIDADVPHVFIGKPKTCDPCINKRCKDAYCMAQITPDEVFSHVKSLLLDS